MRTNRHAVVLMSVLCLAVTGAVTGCATDGSTGGGGGGGSLASNLGSSLMEKVTGDWNLSKLGSESVNQILRKPGVQAAPRMAIAKDGKVNGFAGVNQFFGNLDLGQLAQGNFPLGAMGSTKMAGPPASMDLEQQFLSALSSVRSFDAASLADGVLSLLGDNGQELMRFVRPG